MFYISNAFRVLAAAAAVVVSMSWNEGKIHAQDADINATLLTPAL